MLVFRALLPVLLFAVTASAETIRVGVAISLKEAIGEVARNYESAGGDRVEFIFGSSGQIMAQVRNGAEIDLFVSAASRQVDELQKENLVDSDSRREIVSNTLVLVVPSDAKHPPTSFEALANANVGRVAMGEPKTVPAGQYAQQVFAALHLSDALAGKLVYGTNVRQVLSYVERGEVAAGVVYATDARESGDKVRVVATAGKGLHEPIVYPAVIVAASAKKDAATRFLDYLSGADARAVFKAKGFSVAEEAVTQPAKQ
jgi:molybdate transport system substrate-binding protein